MNQTITFFAVTAEVRLLDNEWQRAYFKGDYTVVYEAEKAKRFDTWDEAMKFLANLNPSTSKNVRNELIKKVKVTIDVQETICVGELDTYTKIKQMLFNDGFRKDYLMKAAERSILYCIGYAAGKCWNEEWTVKFIKEVADAVDFLDDEAVLGYIHEKEGD